MVLELPVTSASCDQKPTVIVEEPQNIANFHSDSIAARRIADKMRGFCCGITPKLSGGLAGAKRRQDRPLERLVRPHAHYACRIGMKPQAMSRFPSKTDSASPNCIRGSSIASFIPLSRAALSGHSIQANTTASSARAPAAARNPAEASCCASSSCGRASAA